MFSTILKYEIFLCGNKTNRVECSLDGNVDKPSKSYKLLRIVVKPDRLYNIISKHMYINGNKTISTN